MNKCTQCAKNVNPDERCQVKMFCSKTERYINKENYCLKCAEEKFGG